MPTEQEMARMMFDSARRKCPQCKCTALTNYETDLKGLPSYVQVAREDINLEYLMYERTRLQKRYLETTFEADIAFVDTDMVFLDDVRNWFARPFDVAVTCRDSAKTDMPINGGLILCRNTEKARQFFAAVESVSRTKYPDRKGWFGDQFALRDVIGLGSRNCSVTSQVVTSDGALIRLLSCDIYNWTPSQGYRSIAKRRDVKLVHFKGGAKELMARFYLAYIQQRMTVKVIWRLYILIRACREIAKERVAIVSGEKA